MPRRRTAADDESAPRLYRVFTRLPRSGEARVFYAHYRPEDVPAVREELKRRRYTGIRFTVQPTTGRSARTERRVRAETRAQQEREEENE